MELKCCKNKKSQQQIKTDRFLRVISQRNRLRILCILKKREMCVCEIWQFLDLPQNLVSHHLKVLKDLGLISSKKVGLKIFYKLNQKVIKKYLKELEKIL